MENLVIVESPAKAKTIEKFLGQGYTVLSSYGHIRDLAKKEMSIDIPHGYEPEYQISDEKKKLVSDLKQAVKKAHTVWLASDEDREGEAIAWHLQETLKLDPQNTRRIVFNEITKKAILNAIASPRSIDMNLVDAQQARRVLDRIVGYEISPILWSKIKPALSAGRVQSVAVRLIVEREEEIRNFVSHTSYRITAQFLPGNSDGSVRTSGAGAPVVAELAKRYDTREEAEAFLRDLAGQTFTVANLETKPARRSPAPPFTTSTLQQEASRKLGFSVARTMQIAQNLYEAGYITYMRTDSVNLSDVALSMAQEEITRLYGKEYLKIRHYQTKTKGAQEAHEAIRPTYMENHTVNADASGRRLYELIWKRAIASQMADAEIERTEVRIESDNHVAFECTGERVRFDGFRKVYFESTDDEPEETGTGAHTLPPLQKGMPMQLHTAQAKMVRTQHPPRYTEASLVKKLEDLGIGRPSTYAPTISTILKREYVMKEDREGQELENTILTLKDGDILSETRLERFGSEKAKLFPTDIGTVVNKFLLEHFADIVDYNFTAKVEKDFDEIAAGNQEWRNVIDRFYIPFHKNIELTQQNSTRTSGSRLVGVDPKTKKNVYAKIGRYGTLVQIGETGGDDKPLFASMKRGQSIESITLEEALELFALPRNLGAYEGKEMTVSIGKYGPYVRLGNEFFSLSKNDDPYTITQERCIAIIKSKREADMEKQRIKSIFPLSLGTIDSEPVTINNGRYGFYLSHGSENYHLSKNIDPETLTLEQAKEIIEKKAKGASAK